jgi:hypothetical protein
VPDLTACRTSAAIRDPAVPVGFQKKCSCHDSRSRRRRLRAGVPTTGHFDYPAYRACVARAVICIVRIVTPRKPQDTATSERPGARVLG